MKIVSKNKKAYFDYKILEEFEAGVALTGQEVKAIKTSKISLKGSYVIIRGGEAFLINCQVPPYQPANAPDNYNPTRARKLLLKKSQIKYLTGKTQEKGLTLVPLMVYTKKGKIKIRIGLAKGKRKKDKREKIKKREQEREIRRQMKF